jgi:hypothetical protein
MVNRHVRAEPQASPRRSSLSRSTYADIGAGEAGSGTLHGTDPAIDPAEPPHERPGPEEGEPRRWFPNPPTKTIACPKPAATRALRSDMMRPL